VSNTQNLTPDASLIDTYYGMDRTGNVGLYPYKVSGWDTHAYLQHG